MRERKRKELNFEHEYQIHYKSKHTNMKENVTNKIEFITFLDHFDMRILQWFLKAIYHGYSYFGPHGDRFYASGLLEDQGLFFGPRPRIATPATSTQVSHQPHWFR